VKELLKSVHICQSYRKNKSDTFLMAHDVCVDCLKILTCCIKLVKNNNSITLLRICVYIASSIINRRLLMAVMTVLHY